MLASSVGASAQTPAPQPPTQAAQIDPQDELKQTKARLAFVICTTSELPRDQSKAVCLRKVAKDYSGTAAAADADARIDAMLGEFESARTATLQQGPMPTPAMQPQSTPISEQIVQQPTCAAPNRSMGGTGFDSFDVGTIQVKEADLTKIAERLATIEKKLDEKETANLRDAAANLRTATANIRRKR